MEDLGSNVLGFLAAGKPARDEGVDAIEVRFVKVSEAARIALRGLDQVLLGVVLGYVQVWLRGFFTAPKGAK